MELQNLYTVYINPITHCLWELACYYHIVGKFGGEKAWQTDSFWAFWTNGAANRLLIETANLDSFSLVNHGGFAKVSPCQIFPLYGNNYYCI